jgi:hypothetical protein
MPSRRIALSVGRSYVVPTLLIVSLVLTAGVAGGAPGKGNENGSGNCNGKSLKKQNCAPSITLVAPAAGATVLGFVDVQTEVNAGVVAVTVRVDGTTIAEDTEAPFTARWDSTKVANGAHTVTATATNGAGESASAASAVNVSNPLPDTPNGTHTLMARNYGESYTNKQGDSIVFTGIIVRPQQRRGERGDWLREDRPEALCSDRV